MTIAKVTRKKAKPERTMMIAISQDNFNAPEPASAHNLSREMHLKEFPPRDPLKTVLQIYNVGKLHKMSHFGFWLVILQNESIHSV